MIIVGLTGGISSGKTVVSQFFQDLGAKVIDADKVYREIIESDPTLSSLIARHFGQEVMREDKGLDRKALRLIVFQDPEKLALLNRITHPFIGKEIRKRIEEIKGSSPHAIIIIEGAILIEAGIPEMIEKVILILSAPETQIRRLMQRDKIEKDEALMRIKSQLPLSEKIPYGDFFIDNEGDRENTKRETERVYRALLALERRKGQ